MKKLLILTICSVLSIALMIKGSNSWFVSSEGVTNDFDVANYGVKLNEVFNGWNQKEVWASNTNDITALVRVSAVPVLKDKEGNRLNTDGVIEIVRPADFDVNWYDGHDGWYYYKKALLPGKETTLFMKKVKFADGFNISQNPQYVDSVLDVDVMMSATAATNTFAHEAVWDVSTNSALKDFLRTICNGL